ncbi:MAG: hypothetical protein J6Y19_05470 [Kiritimatiellae bacterium]|nr:hypothetical protein [Kiritimatiellia bacterium]
MARGAATAALTWVLWWATMLLFMGGVPYGAAVVSSSWLWHAKPTRERADRRLWFCTSRPIEMEDSLWGRNYELKEGERCIQYRVFGSGDCPIDVVYGPEGRVRMVFESYE